MNLKSIIIILAVILLGLLIVASCVSPEADSTPQVQQPTSSIPVTQVTQPTTAPSNPATQPTQIPTQPPTQPVTQPPKKPYSDNPTVNAFVEKRIQTWICPVKDAFGEVVGSRTFGSSRGGGARAHAGLDFVAPHGTKVYAVTSGTVQRVAVFYENTWAVEVLNDDGSILRYCEIATSLKQGDYVKQGSVIGTILRADSGTEMLHMEVYMGNGEGALTQSWNTSYRYVQNKNYLRRNDLIDPTFLKDLTQSS